MSDNSDIHKMQGLADKQYCDCKPKCPKCGKEIRMELPYVQKWRVM